MGDTSYISSAATPTTTMETGLRITIGLRTFRNYSRTENALLVSTTTMTSNNLENFTLNATLVADNWTGSNVSSHEIFEEIPFASSVVLIILYVFTTLAALIGNSLAIIVFARGKRSNTDLRLFLINLAVADLIMAIFCIPFTFAYEITGTWIFSDVMCPIVQSCQVISVTASVSTNTAIGIDRFVAVKFPLRKRVTNSKSKVVILCIWIFAISLGVIPLITSRTVPQPDNTMACEEVWSDHDSQLAYGFFIMIITYFLPVTILSVTYTLVGRQLWLHKLPGNADDHRDAVQLKSKRKVVKMLATIVLLFGVCWLPLHLFMIIIAFNYTAFGDATNKIYFGVHWLSMANSFVNPVIYGFMNENFRADLKNMVESCVCWPWNRNRLKYRPAAMRWRLGDCNVHDASHTAPHAYKAKTLSRYEMELKSKGPRQQRFWENGHANSSPALDVSDLCSCDVSRNDPDNASRNKGRHIGNGGAGGRNIFIAGKRRHYEPCRNENSRPNSMEENGLVMMRKKQERGGNTVAQGNGRVSSGCDVHPSVVFDGAEVKLLPNVYRQGHG